MDDKVQEKIQKFLTTLQDQLYHQKISKEQFAEKMGVTLQTVYNWLTGKSKMSLESYYKALEILGAEDNLKTKKLDI